MTDTNSDGLDIPPFLRREYTPEVAARLKRITARAVARKIKNPRKRRRSTGLGGGFGLKVKVT